VSGKTETSAEIGDRPEFPLHDTANRKLALKGVTCNHDSRL
jgi:hypothetical protein